MLLAGTAILVLVVDLFLDDRAKLVNNYLALAGTVAAGIALATLVGQGNRSTFGGSFVIDNYALLFKGLFLGSLVIVLLMSGRYIVAGFRKGDARSNEGAIKFLLIGVLSTAVMLFGMSLVYGFTGSLNLGQIAQRLQGLGNEPAAVMAVFLLVTGFAVDVFAPRLRFWPPRTYEGAPIPGAARL